MLDQDLTPPGATVKSHPEERTAGDQRRPGNQGPTTELRNGARALDGSAAGLTPTSDLAIVRTLADFDATVSQAWTTSFTPAAGTSLLINEPRPDGTIDIGGTLDWSRPGESFSPAISTPTPLGYDAECQEAQRLVAGELRAAGTFNGEEGYIRLVWEHCGDEPEIRFVRGAR